MLDMGLINIATLGTFGFKTHLIIGLPPSSAEGSKPTRREVAEAGATSTTKGGAACVQGASFNGLERAPKAEKPSCRQIITPI